MSITVVPQFSISESVRQFWSSSRMRLLTASERVSFEAGKEKIREIWDQCERQIDEEFRHYYDQLDSQKDRQITTIEEEREVQSIHRRILDLIRFYKLFSSIDVHPRDEMDWTEDSLTKQTPFVARTLSYVFSDLSYFLPTNPSCIIESPHVLAELFDLFNHMPPLTSNEMDRLYQISSQALKAIFNHLYANSLHGLLSNRQEVREFIKKCLSEVLPSLLTAFPHLVTEAPFGQAVASFTTRIQDQGESVLKSAEALFQRCSLIQPAWLRDMYMMQIPIARLETELSVEPIITAATQKGLIGHSLLQCFVEKFSSEVLERLIPMIEQVEERLKQHAVSDAAIKTFEQSLESATSPDIELVCSLSDEQLMPLLDIDSIPISALSDFLKKGGSVALFCDFFRSAPELLRLPKEFLAMQWSVFFMELSPAERSEIISEDVLERILQEGLSPEQLLQIYHDKHAFELFTRVHGEEADRDPCTLSEMQEERKHPIMEQNPDGDFSWIMTEPPSRDPIGESDGEKEVSSDTEEDLSPGAYGAPFHRERGGANVW